VTLTPQKYFHASKGVGRKFPGGRATKKDRKIAKKDQKIAKKKTEKQQHYLLSSSKGGVTDKKKTTKNSTIKPLSTTSVPCMKIHGEVRLPTPRCRGPCIQAFRSLPDMGAGSRGPCSPQIFKHGTNIINRGLKVLFSAFFCYFFRCPPPRKIFC